jgi:hypothetical protein
MSNAIEVTLVRMERAQYRPDVVESMRVTFRIRRGLVEFEVPVWISPDKFDEADIVRVARSALHQISSDLAAQTTPWAIAPENLPAK